MIVRKKKIGHSLLFRSQVLTVLGHDCKLCLQETVFNRTYTSFKPQILPFKFTFTN